LEVVRKYFLSFEENELGQTAKMKHTTELVPGATTVKGRHYPVYPAEQQLIYGLSSRAAADLRENR